MPARYGRVTMTLQTSLMYSVTDAYGSYTKYRGEIMLQMMMMCMKDRNNGT